MRYVCTCTENVICDYDCDCVYENMHVSVSFGSVHAAKMGITCILRGFVCLNCELAYILFSFQFHSWALYTIWIFKWIKRALFKW